MTLAIMISLTLLNIFCIDFDGGFSEKLDGFEMGFYLFLQILQVIKSTEMIKAAEKTP